MNMSYRYIKANSAAGSSTLYHAGYQAKELAGARARFQTVGWQGRSFECDPRQVGHTFSHGNEQLVNVIKCDAPRMFWESIGSDRTGPGWVMGSFQGKQGNPDNAPVTWTPLDDSAIPSRLGGVRAKVSTQLGYQRGFENIINCRAEVGANGLTTGNVIATHISEKVDRRLVTINDDFREKDVKKQTPAEKARESAINKLDGIPLLEIERTELVTKMVGGKRVCDKLILISSLRESDAPDAKPLQYEVDISWMKVDPVDMYDNPNDAKFGVQLLVNDPLVDFENLGERKHVKTFYNQSIRFTSDGKVRGYRDENKELHFTVETDKSAANPNPPQPIEITGKSWSEVKSKAEYKALRNDQKRALGRAYLETFDIQHFSLDRVTKVRPRYLLQFYHFRESKIEGVKEAGKKVDPAEQIVVTKVLSSAKVAYLDRIEASADGHGRYQTEIVPLNIDPTEGHPERFQDIRIDLRSKAMFNTKFVDPYSTALGPQHLIDPFIIGTNQLSATHPGVDQKGFFGPNILTGMYFPFGNEFTAYENNPYYVRFFGPISHSIFDAKSDAGVDWTWAGHPGMSKASVGAAMVTGPNTDTASPVREGRLFTLRMAGRQPHSVKTAIPGYYITIIEDCQSSYFDMTIFGLATATTTLTLSAGGGLDSFMNFSVQRGQRWNGGIAIYLMDAAAAMREDAVRGNAAYSLLRNLGRGSSSTSGSTGVDFRTCSRSDSTATATNLNAIDRSSLPTSVIPKLRYNEAREWLNVGTWYYIGAARMIAFSLVPILALTTLSPIVAVGLGFLFACTAMTVFGWPFWAGQMAKVGVAPKDIISMHPIQLTFADMPMHTQLKAGVDVERMTLGLFRTSDRTLGNRLFPRDKRTAFWLGMVAPLTVSATMIGGAIGLSFILGALPLALTALPFVVGLAANRIGNRLGKRFIPNPNDKSFGKAAARFALRNIPLVLGIAGSLMLSPFYAVLAIPLITAAMAGGWLAFMGANMFNNFRVYHREQETNHALPAPNPHPGGKPGIPRHKADTWRNTIRQAFGIQPPDFLPEAVEFTRTDDPNIDPYKLWDSLKANFPTITGKDPLANLNAIVGGDGDIPDLYHTLGVRNKSLRAFVRDNGAAGIARWAKVKRLASQTRPVLGPARRQGNAFTHPHQVSASQLSANQYERLRELNRLSIEETCPRFTPRGRWI